MFGERTFSIKRMPRRKRSLYRLLKILEALRHRCHSLQIYDTYESAVANISARCFGLRLLREITWEK